MKPENVVTNIHMQLQAELYRAFDFFNEHYKLKLPRPVIVLGIEHLETRRGHFSHDMWRDSSRTKVEKKLHEIMISGSLLARGAFEALCTLLHEIAHMKNHEEKIEDCKNQRHNKKYQSMAERVGLSCVFMSAQRGFAKTTLLSETRTLIKEQFKPDEELFKLFRVHFNELKKRKEKDKQKTLTPVMIGKDTKVFIELAAKTFGMNQKEFTTSAVRSFAALPSKIHQAATLLATMDDPIKIEKYLVDLLVEKHVAAPRGKKAEVPATTEEN